MSRSKFLSVKQLIVIYFGLLSITSFILIFIGHLEHRNIWDGVAIMQLKIFGYHVSSYTIIPIHAATSALFFLTLTYQIFSMNYFRNKTLHQTIGKIIFRFIAPAFFIMSIIAIPIFPLIFNKNILALALLVIALHLINAYLFIKKGDVKSHVHSIIGTFSWLSIAGTYNWVYFLVVDHGVLKPIRSMTAHTFPITGIITVTIGIALNFFYLSYKKTHYRLFIPPIVAILGLTGLMIFLPWDFTQWPH